MLFVLVLGRPGIVGPTPEAVLLVHEEYHPEGTFGSISRSHEESKNLHALYDPGPIVVGAITQVPRIQMGPNHHDLIGMGTSPDLPNDIEGLNILILPTALPEMKIDVRIQGKDGTQQLC